VAAFAFDFFFRGGQERFDNWRFAGGSGGSALLAAKTASAGGAGGAAPSIAGAASSGGYGSTSLSSGGGGYGSTQ
jgi:hypothetical protein